MANENGRLPVFLSLMKESKSENYPFRNRRQFHSIFVVIKNLIK